MTAPNICILTGIEKFLRLSGITSDSHGMAVATVEVPSHHCRGIVNL